MGTDPLRPDGPSWTSPQPVVLTCGSDEARSVPAEASPGVEWRAAANSPVVQVSPDSQAGPGPVQLTAACGVLQQGTYSAQVLLSAVLPAGAPGFMDSTRLIRVTVIVP